MGRAMHENTNWRHSTQGIKRAATVSCIGPVKIAEGMISPHKSTNVTDTNKASQGGIRSSKKMGNASLAKALSRSKVTRRRWWSLSIGAMRLAASLLHRNLSFSSWVLQSSRFASSMICISLSSNETSPMVRPAASAAHTTHVMAIQTLLQKRNLTNSASRIACSGFLHTGCDFQTPSPGHVIVMACCELPQRKAPSSHSKVYSPR
mmetsp:Transcript_118807/g.378971  ORF Transcript_118807/g.378971 Transcript_118807/m.378971 type:complete len:206 (-) Transcript_118807:920-1537(-)